MINEMSNLYSKLEGDTKENKMGKTRGAGQGNAEILNGVIRKGLPEGTLHRLMEAS